MKKFSILALVVVAIASCKNPEPNNTMNNKTDDESALVNKFLDQSYDEAVDRDPERQTYLGIKKDYFKWTDHSDAHAIEENEINKRELEFLHKNFDFSKLDDQTKISYRYFEYTAQQSIDNFKWRFHNYPINQMDGIQSGLPAFLINMHRIDTVTDADAYIGRLNGIGRVFDQVIEGLKTRDSMKIIPPKFVFPMVLNDCKNVITGQPFDQSKEKSPLYEDFFTKVNALNNLDATAKLKLIHDAEGALKNTVKPAYQKLMLYLADEEKKATEEDGAWKFPDGNNFYSNALKVTTTTDLSPDAIFEKGQQEVDRIHDEMKAIMKQVHWKNDDLSEFFEFMRKDKQFYFPNTPEGKKAYKDKATAIIDSMRTKLDVLFLTKPKADILVKAVEPFREKSAGGAFYEDPSEDGKRPGTYYINLYNMDDQPIYQMESLAYHEGIPGHHMQIAIAQELKNIPKFRKHGGNVAYVEGWALYAEYVPKEYGFYKDPYSDFGRLANEVFRAARLVVDVGIHYKKWTRKEALDYFLKNTPNPEGDSRKEIDRYTVWPSQATGYKIGMLKILELREQAKTALGDKFDIREFHDVILTNGSLPLNLLSDNVNQWIDKKKKQS
jgi:uncharacterized protein (DUF885 family)